MYVTNHKSQFTDHRGVTAEVTQSVSQVSQSIPILNKTNPVGTLQENNNKQKGSGGDHLRLYALRLVTDRYYTRER